MYRIAARRYLCLDLEAKKGTERVDKAGVKEGGQNEKEHGQEKSTPASDALPTTLRPRLLAADDGRPCSYRS